MCTQGRGDSIYSMKKFAEEFVEIFDEKFDGSDTAEYLKTNVSYFVVW